MEPEQEEETKPKSSYYSKQYERCGYKNCNQNVRRDNIRNHQSIYGHPFVPKGTQRIDSMFRSEMSGTVAKSAIDEHEKRQQEEREKERLDAIRKQEDERRELEKAEVLKAKLKKADEERKEREAAAAERIRLQNEEKQKLEEEKAEAMKIAEQKAELQREADLEAEAAKESERKRLEQELAAQNQKQVELEEKAEGLRQEGEQARKSQTELAEALERQNKFNEIQKIDQQLAATQMNEIREKINVAAEKVSKNSQEAFVTRRELASTVQTVKSLQKQLINFSESQTLPERCTVPEKSQIRTDLEYDQIVPTSVESSDKRKLVSPGTSPARKKPNYSTGESATVIPQPLELKNSLQEFHRSSQKNCVGNQKSKTDFEKQDQFKEASLNNVSDAINEQPVPENINAKFLDDILYKYLNQARENIMRDATANYFTTKQAELENIRNKEGNSDVTSNAKLAFQTNVENYQQRKQSVKHATSVKDVLFNLPHYKLKYASDTARLEGTPNGIECSKCADPNDQRIGKFTYDSSIPEVCEDGKMSEQFSNLKKHVLRHEELSIHKAKINQQIQDESYIPSEREKQAAINCGMTAYKCIVNHKSQLEYEAEIAHMAACGANVGQLNHSRKFVSLITPSLSEELKSRMMDRLNTPIPATGRPSPISVVADKVTLNHKTWQPTGINALVKGELKTLLIDIPVVKDHTGRGSAEEIKTSLEKVLPPDLDSNGKILRTNLRERFVGGSMDGQYIRNNVGVHLSNQIMGLKLDAQNNNNSVQANPSSNVTNASKSKRPEQITGYHGFNWDAAHLVENAELHAREDKKIGKPIRDVQKTIKEIQRDSTYGKSFEQLVSEQAANSRSVRSPLAFSETKFTGHCSNVLENANHNFPGHYDMLMKNNDSRAEKINNADYVMNSSGVRDAYSRMQKVSKEVQRPDATCWQVDKSIKNAVEDMRQMADNLSANNYGAPNLSKFNDAASQLRADGLYQQKPILDSKYGNIGTRQQDEPNTNFESAINKSAARIAEFDKKFADELEARYTKYKPAVNDLVGATFAREQIIERGNTAVPPELYKYSDLAKEAEHLPSTVTNKHLDQQYRHFAGEVIRRTSENPKQSEQDMYKDFLNDGTQKDKCGDVAHLLAAGIVRTSNEAVVESMASVAKNHMDKRGNLSPATFNHEMNLHWNGPKVGENCKPLVEDALRRHYKGDNFRFYRKCEETRPDKIQQYTTSKVVDRKNSEKGRIPFD